MSIGRNSFRRKLQIFRWLVLLFLLLVLSGFALVMLGRMEDTVEGRGTVHGLREHELKSSVRSRIVALRVKPGAQVKAGDVLLELDDRELREARQRLENQIREMEAELDVRRWALKVLRHDPLPQEYRHTDRTLVEYREREVKSRRELEIFRELARKKAVSQVELQQKELAHLKDQTELQKLEADSAKLRDGLEQDIIRQAETGISLLEQRLAGRKNELAMLKEHEADFRIVAPENGTVGYIPTKRGIYVEPGQLLAILAAAGPKKFIAYVDEKDIFKVREEQRVRIESSQYNYFEYGYFYGKVYAIDELPEVRGTRNCYGVRILLDDDSAHPLRLGSTGEAEIIVGRDFIFRILTGLR